MKKSAAKSSRSVRPTRAVRLAKTTTAARSAQSSRATQPSTQSKMSSVLIAAGFIALGCAGVGYTLGKQQTESIMMSLFAHAEPIDVDPMANWQTYSSQDGQIVFRAPAKSKVKVAPGVISIAFGDGQAPDILTIAYAAGNRQPQGYAGTAAAGEDAEDAGTVSFLSTEIRKKKLLTDGQTAEVLYGGDTATSRVLKRENMNFLITMQWGADSADGIPVQTQTLADQIISTVQVQK